MINTTWTGVADYSATVVHAQYTPGGYWANGYWVTPTPATSTAPPRQRRRWDGPWRRIRNGRETVWARPMRSLTGQRWMRLGPVIDPGYDETDMTNEEFDARMAAGSPVEVEYPDCEACRDRKGWWL